MDKVIISSTVLEIIRDQLDITIDSASTQELLFSSIGIDSIAMMTLLVFVEEKFEFVVDEDALISNRFVKISDLVDYIYEKINK